MPRSTIDVKWVEGRQRWTVNTPFRQMNESKATKDQAITAAKNLARPDDRILIYKKNGELQRMIEVDSDVNSNNPFDVVGI